MLVTTAGDEREGKLSAWKGLRLLSICSSLDPSGTELNAIRSAELLSSLGVSIEVLNVGRDGLLSERYEQIANLHHAPMVRFGSSYHLKSISHLKSILDRFKPHVVHAQDAYTVGLLGVFPKRLRARTVANRRWLGAGRRWLDILNELAYTRVDAIAVNSKNVLESMKRRNGNLTDKLVFTPNFLPSAAFITSKFSMRSRCRATLGMGESAVLVCCVARLSKAKRHDLLIDAFSKLLKDRQLDAQLVLVGDGPERSTLQNQAESLGVAANTHFLGHISVPSEIVGSSDIAVLCSDREGMPNTLIEAAAAGLPIVAADVGGISEIVRHQETGLLFSPGSSDQCAASLSLVASDRQLRLNMGVEARRLAKQNHSEDAYLKSLAVAYGLPRTTNTI